MKSRFHDSGGFTLIESLVATLMMLTVLFALYSALDAGVRVFRFGGNQTEAVEQARLGMERMERDIRGAFPVDPASGKTHLFFQRSNLESAFPSADSITFGNDLDGNGRLDCAAGGACEYVTYDVYRPAGATDDALSRRTGSTRQGVVDHLRDTDGDSEPLTFEYLDDELSTAANEADISIVRVRLEVAVEGREQILSTDIALRNRSG